jgi:hypothetical protein
VNQDFMQIKVLEGELKLSHKKRDLGLTLSTKELVVQKPHVNYHVMLADIISIVPTEGITWKPKTIVQRKGIQHEIKSYGIGLNHYRIYAKAAKMHNRSGIFDLGVMEVILPIHPDLLHVIGQYAQLDSF